MELIAITGQGLRWITVLVTLLWLCVVAEDRILRHARHNATRTFAELRRMREGQRPLPASNPLRQSSPFSKPALS